MRLGVLSDTHASSIERLPARLIDELTGMDVIVHAGDYTEKRLLDELRRLGSFRGVYGNMDSYEVRMELPEKDILELKGHRIGIVHPPEGGSPFGIEGRIRKRFDKVDAIIYGHTHTAKKELMEGILFLNPGSGTGAWPARKRSFAIVTIGDDTIDAEIVTV